VSAGLAGVVHGLVTDLFDWLGDYPDDQVDAAALAVVRGDLLRPHPGTLAEAVGVLVDLVWWLDACEDDEVDPHVAVKLLEAAVSEIDGMPDEQRRTLVGVVDELATSEQHAGRHYELRFFAYGMGLADDEPEAEEPAGRQWVRPVDRGQ
jgi:hypothetical protein